MRRGFGGSAAATTPKTSGFRPGALGSPSRSQGDQVCAPPAHATPRLRLESPGPPEVRGSRAERLRFPAGEEERAAAAARGRPGPARGRCGRAAAARGSCAVELRPRKRRRTPQGRPRRGSAGEERNAGLLTARSTYCARGAAPGAMFSAPPFHHPPGGAVPIRNTGDRDPGRWRGRRGSRGGSRPGGSRLLRPGSRGEGRDRQRPSPPTPTRQPADDPREPHGPASRPPPPPGGWTPVPEKQTPVRSGPSRPPQGSALRRPAEIRGLARRAVRPAHAHRATPALRTARLPRHPPAPGPAGRGAPTHHSAHAVQKVRARTPTGPRRSRRTPQPAATRNSPRRHARTLADTRIPPAATAPRRPPPSYRLRRRTRSAGFPSPSSAPAEAATGAARDERRGRRGG
ncbi:collagen alpha-1(I) chain-like [Dipodomys merriami]|uniref:collagen alpha-1(I) chain-like n=1 Tax=Dipodomys merriami TaxID=94247 RepID=UPI003850D783